MLQRLLALGRGLEASGVSPLAQGGLNEALGLAIGARRVGSRAQVLEPKPSAGFGKDVRDIGRAVIGHDPSKGHTAGAVVRYDLVQEGHRRFPSLVIGQGRRSQSRVVVDGDMHKLPADAAVPIPALPVTRCPGEPIRPSFLMSRWMSSPGAACSYRCTGGCGTHSRHRLMPARRSTLETVAGDRPVC